jgi:CRP-like cAMP-binding protein
MSIAGIFPIDKWNFKSQSILTTLPAEEYERLCAHMSNQQYEKGAVLFREGTIPSGIFFIKKGKVKKYLADRDGKEQIIYVANSGELIGYHAILNEGRYPDSAATLEASEIAFIPKEDFLETLAQSAVLSQRLLKMLSHEFTVLSNSISVFAHRSVKERLAIALIVLREKFKEGTAAGKPVVLEISRSDLAGMTGTGKENVVRFLKEFKEEGILDTKGRKIFIYDVKKLISLSGMSHVK